jgi:hypothetical protein
MDRLLKRIQQVRPVMFRSRDFLLLHDNASAHKAANVRQFLSPKKLPPFITRVLSRLISARLFSDPQIKKKLKGLQFADVAEIQGAVIDELKKVQK